MAPAVSSDLLGAIRRVAVPTPILSREAEAALTDRQREVLDGLDGLFDNGFAHFTMADIAGAMNCSLRTLYSLAGSRDQLVLTVIDRQLWRIGRSARNAIKPDSAPLDAVRTYLRMANTAVARTTEAFARDTEALAVGRELNDAHSNYLVGVTRALLDEAVRRKEIAPCNTAAVARVVAGLGRDLARPEVLPGLGSSPKKAADDMVDVILNGLAH